MKKVAIIVGGSGFIGGYLIRDLLLKSEFDLIYNFDLREKNFSDCRIKYFNVDVRKPIQVEIETGELDYAWIFNLAALCREPGYEAKEYFDTNVGGANNVTLFARQHGIRNIFFTSTMSSFGRMEKPTCEGDFQYPETPYGVSKLVAEKIHEIWLAESSNRRLIICRPAVIFGPGDDQNVPRLIRTIRMGFMLFPGNPRIVKAYGYVRGLVESIQFTRGRNQENFIVYHYAEDKCQTLEGMVKTISKFMNKNPLLLNVPISVLIVLSSLIQFLVSIFGKKSSVHPTRIRKLAFPTNLQPKYLIATGFLFKYPLEQALADWKNSRPEEWL